ncbi:MAG: tryptophan-rich sensory protein [Proteobacteria bacterium]|nr:tryptophan-rich sensory protein [Pseudomonadota bacterium]
MLIPIVVAIVAVTVVAVAGALLTRIDGWYRALRKPTWQPPDWLFGPVWTAIFAMVAASGVLAWRATEDGGPRGWILGLFALNGVLNMAWSGLFFTLRRPDWALAEVVPLWLSIVALIVAIAPVSSVGAWLLVPYLLWVAFAAFLNLTVVRLNGTAAQGVSAR